MSFKEVIKGKIEETDPGQLVAFVMMAFVFLIFAIGLTVENYLKATRETRKVERVVRDAVIMEQIKALNANAGHFVTDDQGETTFIYGCGLE